MHKLPHQHSLGWKSCTLAAVHLKDFGCQDAQTPTPALAKMQESHTGLCRRNEENPWRQVAWERTPQDFGDNFCCLDSSFPWAASLYLEILEFSRFSSLNQKGGGIEIEIRTYFRETILNLMFMKRQYKQSLDLNFTNWKQDAFLFGQVLILFHDLGSKLVVLESSYQNITPSQCYRLYLYAFNGETKKS